MTTERSEDGVRPALAARPLSGRVGDGRMRRLVFHMPKKQKRTEAEVHAMIVRDAKIRLGCADFARRDYPVITSNQNRPGCPRGGFS